MENIAAWVDRKLFIHNLGHAASAYLGFKKYPTKNLIAEVLEADVLKLQVRKVMAESAAALTFSASDESGESFRGDSAFNRRF